MSHQATIKTKIRDLEALREACKTMGLELKENTNQRTYSGSVKQPLVIKCKGPYDIAVKQEPDLTYSLSTDWWAGHVAKEVGTNYSKLTQEYGVAKATLEAEEQGYFVERELNEQGHPRLTITGRTW